MKTKTYGIKLNDGQIIQIRTKTDWQAKLKAGLSNIHSIWQIGEVWDEQGKTCAHNPRQNISMKKYLAILTLTVATTAHAGDYTDYRNGSNSPHIYSPEGEYLGNLNNNKYDPDSVSNPYGAGSQYRYNGVNNPYSPNYRPELNCDY